MDMTATEVNYRMKNFIRRSAPIVLAPLSIDKLVPSDVYQKIDDIMMLAEKERISELHRKPMQEG